MEPGLQKDVPGRGVLKDRVRTAGKSHICSQNWKEACVGGGGKQGVGVHGGDPRCTACWAEQGFGV